MALGAFLEHLFRFYQVRLRNKGDFMEYWGFIGFSPILLRSSQGVFVQGSHTIRHVMVQVGGPCRLAILLCCSTFRCRQRIIRLQFSLFQVGILSTHPRSRHLTATASVGAIVNISHPRIAHARPTILHGGLKDHFLILVVAFRRVFTTRLGFSCLVVEVFQISARLRSTLRCLTT